MGATKIMVIRHAEKPARYDGQDYSGVDATGTTCGPDGEESLVTIGWERAGALITLFAPPWGPRTPTLAVPQHLYAANPKTSDAGKTPSQRPYQTIAPLATKLGLTIDTRHKKKDYPGMVTDALAKDGVVLICWEHEDIPLVADSGPGISRCILTGSGTSGTLGVPSSWPKGPGGARYDLVWVFDRPSGTGPITGFTQFAQRLLPGDA
ncbi:MAG TPA: hypothetical protein VGI78_30945 [Acetobacteraceae bacterium]